MNSRIYPGIGPSRSSGQRIREGEAPPHVEFQPMKKLPTRLLFWTLLAAAGVFNGPGALASQGQGTTPEALDIGSRLELFVDRHLIDAMDGVELELGQPQPRERVFRFDQPWEGNTPGHVAVFKDGDVYRMYYRGSAHEDYLIREELHPGEKIVPSHPKVSCYAESRDGIHWTRPSLGQVEFQGSRDNNILDLGGATKFNPFRDENPEAPESARYKGIGFHRVPGAPPHSGKLRGLVPLQSSDAVTWTWMAPEPVITDGYFDSHNVAFWDGVRGHYVALYRDFAHGVRSLKYATSKDFVQVDRGRVGGLRRRPAGTPVHQRHGPLFSRAAHLRGLSQAVCALAKPPALRLPERRRAAGTLGGGSS